MIKPIQSRPVVDNERFFRPIRCRVVAPSRRRRVRNAPHFWTTLTRKVCCVASTMTMPKDKGKERSSSVGHVRPHAARSRRPVVKLDPSERATETWRELALRRHATTVLNRAWIADLVKTFNSPALMVITQLYMHVCHHHRTQNGLSNPTTNARAKFLASANRTSSIFLCASSIPCFLSNIACAFPSPRCSFPALRRDANTSANCPR